MISFLKGSVRSIDFSEVVLDVNGVGYGLNMSISDVSSLSIGGTVEAHVVEVIREQAYDLYGFIEADAKSLFQVLIKVNGVGPRIALALIGMGDGDSMARAVSNGNSAYFSKAPGVGPKLADRLCVELKGKLEGISLNTKSVTKHSSNDSDSLEIESALEALGFKPADVQRMAGAVDRSLPVEEQVRQALRER